MLKEYELNSIIKKSLDWAHKISDAGQIEHGKSPFDGFGRYKVQPVYWESKFLPEVKSFNFNRLEDHQLESLKETSKIKDSLSLFLIGVVFGRNDIRVFIFRDLNYIENRKKEKRNILKKEFLERTNFIKIKKGMIDIEELLNIPLENEYFEGNK